MADPVSEPANWTEHTHGDGRRYFYNKVTKASSWDKPVCLKSGEEKLNTGDWKEYKTADGRDYFFNPVTKLSVWEMPAELKRLRGLMKKEDSDDEKEEKEEEKEEEPEWKTPEERRNAFKEVLEEKGVKAAMKWEEALKLIQDDRRFNALPSAGEKKQVFAEYLSQTKKREVEELREKKKKAKDEFTEALHAWKELKVTSRYKDSAEAFQTEEWFKLMEEDERDELFQDFMDEYEKKAKEERRKNRKEYVEKVKEVYAENKDIKITSRWRDVQDVLKDNDAFRWLSKLEALTSWEEWVLDAEKTELQEQTKAKFRIERKARDEFRAFLRKHGEDGKIKVTTDWGKYAEDSGITKDDKYLALIAHPGSTPHDLFDDFIEELGDRYTQDRNKIKKLAKAKHIVITPSSTYADFEAKLKDEAGFKELEEEHRKSAFESLVAKAKEAQEDEEKNAKKNRKKFVELLQKSREVTAKTTFDKAEKILGSNSAWEAVDEDTRRQCFNIFVDQLKIQSGSAGAADDDASDESAEVQKKDKKKEKEVKGGKKRKQEEEEEDEPKKKKKKAASEEEEEAPKKKKTKK